jgi:RNA polymerase sigma-70 factor (ECF subfamily)
MLTPTERAVFLLREVFDYEYAAISQTVHKSIPNCRQIARCARQQLVLRRPTLTDFDDRDLLVERFLECWERGDLPALMTLMAADVTFWSDGGGKVVAAHKPLHGCQKVARFLVAIRHSRLTPTLVSQVVAVNGHSGIIKIVDEHTHSIFSFEFTDNCIRSIFAVVNPAKLGAVKL